MIVDDYTPLHAVRTALAEAAADGGADCPACHQHVRIYVRPMTSPMARLLVEMYAANEAVGATPATPVHVPVLLRQRLRDVAAQGGYVTLAHLWGLIERGFPLQGFDRRGYWGLTNLGVGFVRGAARVPRAVEVYNGRVRGTQGPMITIRDALGEDFDLDALLAGRPGPERTAVTL
jgi:hypothetical protein